MLRAGSAPGGAAVRVPVITPAPLGTTRRAESFAQRLRPCPLAPPPPPAPCAQVSRPSSVPRDAAPYPPPRYPRRSAHASSWRCALRARPPSRCAQCDHESFYDPERAVSTPSSRPACTINTLTLHGVLSSRSRHIFMQRLDLPTSPKIRFGSRSFFETMRMCLASLLVRSFRL